ncbi:DEAD/DEAH box helicase [Immundisolibacter sp.]|uniref:DEAD/DEAH box helicase n=1 Tax=Immundisolibacter sp. TaxID=1934948 RepID=UPI003568EB5E
MTTDPDNLPTFAELDLAPVVLEAVTALGYEIPTPIQARIIPFLLAGRDVLGQAQTGTGKTAAFALPILSRIDAQLKQVQVMVLTPTRELAIQVAQAFTRYGAHLPGLRVLSVYGGQGYRDQLRELHRGVQVVVGTPGRVMDHMRRGTLDLSALGILVLDEADEMLRMGFIDDVEWILSETPATRQVALFSATLPTPIKRIAQRHLKDPQEVSIKVRTTTAETIRQRYWRVSGVHKREALTRILETTPHEGVIVFVRTKTETLGVADYLIAQGYAAAPLNGDIQQNVREHTVSRLKSGKLNILVATDVAARGLDVERISHVINYDIPNDTESYVHRIGRTGRAGRSGEAILFVAPREMRMLQAIERATRQRIEEMPLPGVEAVNQRRIERFCKRIDDALSNTESAETLDLFRRVLGEYETEKSVPSADIAAALAILLQGDEPLLLAPERKTPRFAEPRSTGARLDRTPAPGPGERRPPRAAAQPTGDLESYRVEVGATHGAKPSNLVGAIANEAGIDSKYIGRIEIYEGYSTVDLPQGMPNDLLEILKRTRVAGQPLAISRVADGAPKAGPYQATRASRDPAPDSTPRPFKPRLVVGKPGKPGKLKVKTGYPKRRPAEGS